MSSATVSLTPPEADGSLSLPPLPQKADFDSIYSDAALYEAALRVYTKPLFRPEKGLVSSHDSRTLYHFAQHGPRNLEKLAGGLSLKEFRFREGIAIHYNRSRKHRIIYLFPWEERIVDQWLYQALNKFFHSAFSDRSYAYRNRGYGVDACQHLIAKYFKATPQPFYVVKRDVSNYYPTVNQGILLSLIEQWVEKDDYLYELLQQRVRFRFRAEGGENIHGTGIPFGTPIACLFANIYLTPLDMQLTSIPDLTYFRYADDLLTLTRSRQAALEANERLTLMLGRLKLKSKPSHELNIAFGDTLRTDSGFDSAPRLIHLGLELRSDGTVGLSRAKARKARRLFRGAFEEIASELKRLQDPVDRAQVLISVAKRVIERGVRSIAILDYYLKHVDDEKQLRLLDRWLAEEVLYRSFQTGHRKGNFRRLSFKRLRKMGLPSLLHRQRLLRHGKIKSSFFVLWTNWLSETETRIRASRRKQVQRERERLPGRKTLSSHLEAAADTSPVR